MWKSWFLYSVGTVVTICFVVAFIFDMLYHRDVPVPLYGMMGLVVGAVFGKAAINGRNEP